MPYPSSRISSRSLKNIAEKPSAPTATNWDTGRKTVVSTNVPTATYTNPTTRNTYASSNHSDLMVDLKHRSNKNHHHPHHSLFASPIREDSKPGNLHPPSHHPPPPHPAGESTRTKEKERRRITIPANKERSKEKSTELSTTSKGSGTEGWKNSPNNKTNPTNMTMKPSITSTRNRLDFRSSWKFRTVDEG